MWIQGAREITKAVTGNHHAQAQPEALNRLVTDRAVVKLPSDVRSEVLLDIKAQQQRQRLVLNAQLSRHIGAGISLYLSEVGGWNVLDLSIYSSIVTVLILRWVERAFRLNGSVIHLPHPARSLLSFVEFPGHMMSLLIVPLMNRILHVFRLSATLGVLVNSIWRMGRDILTFLVLFAIVLLSFAVPLHFIYRDAAAGGYKDLASALLSLFKASVGEFDFDAFEIVVDANSTVAKGWRRASPLLGALATC